MELILDRNHQAFTELVTRHSSRFYSLAYRTLFDKVAAQDVVQEAFLKLWRNPQRWNGSKGVKFTTWFYQLTLNLCLDINKKKQPLALTPQWDACDDTSDLERVHHQHQRQQLVDQAIAQLPQTQRTALNLCFYEKRSNQEAADIMGISLKALQSLLIRAKASLRKQLQSAKAGGVHA